MSSDWRTALACATAATVAIVIGAGGQTPLRAQQTQTQIQIGGGAATTGGQPAAPTGPMAFDVASVKPNQSGDGNIRIGLQPGGRMVVTNVPARQLIIFAYQLQNFQLIDAPDWTRDTRYDINAKAAMDFGPAPLGTVGAPQLMLRSLLADRFSLVVHEETREMPIYALVLARPDGQLGPKLQRATTDCTALAAARRGGGPPPAPPQPGVRPQCGMFGGRGSMLAGAMPMSQLAQFLSGQAQRIVTDKTGLTGGFDFELTFTPDQPAQLPGGGDPNAGAAAASDGPSLFTAIQEQLGLKLQAERGPVKVLVVDKIERPTPD